MTQNALSSLIVIFPYNSNKQRPQTESCVFSDVGACTMPIVVQLTKHCETLVKHHETLVKHSESLEKHHAVHTRGNIDTRCVDQGNIGTAISELAWQYQRGDIGDCGGGM